MTERFDPVVEAEIDFDQSRMDEAIGEAGEDHPLRKYYLAICDSRVMRSLPEPGRRAAIRRLAALIDDPPAERELFLIMLVRLVRSGVRAGFPWEARRALRLLEEGVAEEPCRREIRALAHLCRAGVEFFEGNYPESLKGNNRAVETAGPSRPRLQYALRASRMTAALQCGDSAQAEDDLAFLERPPVPEGILVAPIEYLRLQLLDHLERHAEALDLIERVTGGSVEGAWAELAVDRVRMMIKVGRGREALELLEKHADSISPFQRELLRAVEASLRRDFAAAREHARRSVGAPGVRPRDLRHAAWTLAAIELNDRRPRAARKILASIDPRGSDAQYAMEWARLLWAEGDPAGAARHFRRVLAYGRSEHIVNVMVDVHEMSTHDMGTLWRLALIPPDAAGAWAQLQPYPENRSGGAAPIRPRRRRSRRAALVGESPAMRRIRDDVARFAPLDETVLVTGETGTGKELVAHMLHDSGPRAKEPFLAVNCAAISDTLLESELFGHVRGAFTGAVRDHEGLLVAAGGGTLFLDEIDSMSPRVQGSLLRVLEERRVRPVGASRDRAFQARVVAAGSAALSGKARDGGFRSDLYYRLARLELVLPTLAERREDIPLLARHFLEEQFDAGELSLGADLLAELSRRDWPGNVRELRNEVQRLALLGGEEIGRASCRERG